MPQSKDVLFDHAVDCMHGVRDQGIRKISAEYISEMLCMFLHYEASIDPVEVNIESEVAMNSAWR